MGSSSSLASPIQSPSPSSFSRSFSSPPPLPSEEYQQCELIWEELLTLEKPPISSIILPLLYVDRPFRLYFYSKCYTVLLEKIVERGASDGHHHLPANSGHTIMIFMLKFISLYVTTMKSNQRFEKYSKSLALSCAHLGIRPTYFQAFDDAFCDSVKESFGDSISTTWHKLFEVIFYNVLAEYERREFHNSMSRPLRSPGSREVFSSEEETIAYYADYAWKLVLSSGQEEEENPNSVYTRLSTSLEIGVSKESEDILRTSANFKSQASL